MLVVYVKVLKWFGEYENEYDFLILRFGILLVLINEMYGCLFVGWKFVM